MNAGGARGSKPSALPAVCRVDFHGHRHLLPILIRGHLVHLMSQRGSAVGVGGRGVGALVDEGKRAILEVYVPLPPM